MTMAFVHFQVLPSAVLHSKRLHGHALCDGVLYKKLVVFTKVFRLGGIKYEGQGARNCDGSKKYQQQMGI